jgi:HEAT repeat protein
VETDQKGLGQRLEAWSRGLVSLEETRSLAADLGNQHYAQGILALMELLGQDDEIVRYNAAMSLGFEFQYLPAADKLLRMLAEDRDEDCKDMAAGAIGIIFQGSSDPRILRALGKAALEDPDEGVRTSAYRALLGVNGLSTDEHLQLLREQNLPVDRDRVDKICKG